MHCDGDGAVRAALDGVEVMLKEIGGADIRPAMAHAEIVHPADFPRFKALGMLPVLSFQWEKPAGDTMGLTNYFGPERMKILEPGGLLAAAGARVVFGSDWPVDPLDEWFALKVGVTRTNAPNAPPEFKGRLGDDPGLSPEAVLRAATIDAAYELHQDDVTGSLEVGKFADIVAIDRNPLKISAEDIANVRVLETIVGGTTVYEASSSKAAGSADEEKVWSLEKDYWHFVQNSDLDHYRALWHPQFLGWPSISPEPLRKDHITDWITTHTGKGESLKSYDLERLTVQVTGDVTTTTYRVRSVWADRTGREQPGTVRIIHTWLRQGGTWQIISGMSAPTNAEGH
jgi:ketosteroid isomerase-like protein